MACNSMFCCAAHSSSSQRSIVPQNQSTYLLNALKSRVKPAEFTRRLIKDQLAENNSEIVTTLLKVSLNCPLGKTRITLPCRALSCSHVQCFDATSFLQLNAKRPTYKCPVCNKPAFYEALMIDGYFNEVLASPFLHPEDTEIQLHKDGSWSSCRADFPTVEAAMNLTDSIVEILDDSYNDIQILDWSPQLTNGFVEIVDNNQQANLRLPLPSTRFYITNASVDLTHSDNSDDDLTLNQQHRTGK